MNLVIPLALPLLHLMERRDSLLLDVSSELLCMDLVVFALVVLLHIFDMFDATAIMVEVVLRSLWLVLRILRV